MRMWISWKADAKETRILSIIRLELILNSIENENVIYDYFDPVTYIKERRFVEATMSKKLIDFGF